MIPDKNTLTRFLKARMNFFVYGPRASGKTTLLKEVFQNSGIDYIYINCTMGDKKTNFFRYLNHEFDKFFKKKIKEDQRSSKALQQSYIKPSDPTSVYAWIQNIKNLAPQIRAYLQNIYFFIDNIEEIHVSANFMTTFFSACQQNIIDDLKIPFVFCGITLPKKVYAVDKPFRNIISFCMKKPTEIMQRVIKEICKKFFNEKFRGDKGLKKDVKKEFSSEDIEKAGDQLANLIYHAFEPMETDLNRIQKMASVLANEIAEQIQREIRQEEDLKKADKDKTLTQRIQSKINKGEIKVYTREMLEQGPVGDFMLKRKVSKQLHNEQTTVQLPYQYYPQLLITSLHLADLASETEDKRRFQDYKTQKGRGAKNIENRIAKHNIQRIIAISETLESIGKKDGLEYPLSHHSIDFYACFEYLRQEEKIYIQGKNLSFASTKIYGDTKLDEATTFLKAKMHLDYKDYVLQ